MTSGRSASFAGGGGGSEFNRNIGLAARLCCAAEVNQHRGGPRSIARFTNHVGENSTGQEIFDFASAGRTGKRELPSERSTQRTATYACGGYPPRGSATPTAVFAGAGHRLGLGTHFRPPFATVRWRRPSMCAPGVLGDGKVRQRGTKMGTSGEPSVTGDGPGGAGFSAPASCSGSVSAAPIPLRSAEVARRDRSSRSFQWAVRAA